MRLNLFAGEPVVMSLNSTGATTVVVETSGGLEGGGVEVESGEVEVESGRVEVEGGGVPGEEMVEEEEEGVPQTGSEVSVSSEQLELVGGDKGCSAAAGLPSDAESMGTQTPRSGEGAWAPDLKVRRSSMGTRPQGPVLAGASLSVYTILPVIFVGFQFSWSNFLSRNLKPTKISTTYTYTRVPRKNK